MGIDNKALEILKLLYNAAYTASDIKLFLKYDNLFINESLNTLIKDEYIYKVKLNSQEPLRFIATLNGRACVEKKRQNNWRWRVPTAISVAAFILAAISLVVNHK